MTVRIGVLGVLAAATLTACAVVPPTAHPFVPTPQAYASPHELVSLRQRVRLDHQLRSAWWTLFGSGPLDGLIRTVVAGNQDLRAARARLAAARAAVQAGRGALLPQVALGAQAGRQKYGVALFGPSQFSIPPFNYYEAGPSATWTPDLFGAQRNQVARLQARADYELHELEAADLTLTGEAVAVSLDMAEALGERAAVRRIVAEDRQTLGLVQAARAIGTATEVAVLSAQAQLLTDSARLAPLARRVAADSHALSVLAGRLPTDWTPPRLGLDEFRVPSDLPLQVPSQLLRNRPDILAAQANLKAAAAAVGVATAHLYPTVTLSADMLAEALTPAALFGPGAGAYSLAAGLAQPIFSGGTLSAEKREAQAAYRAAAAQYRQTVLNAFGQVATALTSLAHDDAAAAAQKNAYRVARRTARLAVAAYRLGSIGLLRVQDAQRAAAAARLALLRAEARRARDAARLFVAAGGAKLGS
ncbi:MAG: efflux transporter outer membrane subunit [Betaproteobacteria bacterium]|nr:efflux transporter outer membrane subunit [Betaproteobacteria bacterium]